MPACLKREKYILKYQSLYSKSKTLTFILSGNYSANIFTFMTKRYQKSLTSKSLCCSNVSHAESLFWTWKKLWAGHTLLHWTLTKEMWQNLPNWWATSLAWVRYTLTLYSILVFHACIPSLPLVREKQSSPFVCGHTYWFHPWLCSHESSQPSCLKVHTTKPS